MTTLKIGDIVRYVGKQQNQCYTVPNIGTVVNLTEKRVMVVWKTRDGGKGVRSHVLRHYNVERFWEDSYVGSGKTKTPEGG